MLNRLYREEQGIVTLEWIILAVLLAVGLIAGLGVARNAISLEMADVANAANGYDASYNVQGLSFTTTGPDGQTVNRSETSKYSQGKSKTEIMFD